MKRGLLLAIETSCDETAIAIINFEGRIVGENVFSHADIHKELGGIVPEIQARAHLPRLSKLISKTCESENLQLEDIDAFAATLGPGLIGSLMCGSVFARTLAWRFGKPFFAVNHLAGHALSPLINRSDLTFPYLLLLVSGGHTQILLVEEAGKYQRLGSTLDDSVGEAFDKVGSMLGLDYPQGPKLEQLAKGGDAYRFKLPSPFSGAKHCNFSFSGLKSAVKRIVQMNNQTNTLADDNFRRDLAASFQRAACDALIDRCAQALEQTPQANFLAAAGGVATNQTIRSALEQLAKSQGLDFVAPALELCTDNASMIAFAALEQLKAGKPDTGKGTGLDCAANPSWSLEQA